MSDRSEHSISNAPFPRMLISAFLLPVLLSDASAADVSFKRRKLIANAYAAKEAETGTIVVCDINKDGEKDILTEASKWYEGPAWTPHRISHDLSSPTFAAVGFRLVHDIDGDGWVDVLGCREVTGYSDNEWYWFKNPGPPFTGPWSKYVIGRGKYFFTSVDFIDIDGDGRHELLTALMDINIWEIPDDPTAAPGSNWTNTRVGRDDHGIGVGDLNEDGRLDVIGDFNWYEQTPSGGWTKHSLSRPPNDGWPYYEETWDPLVYDVDDDGDSDIIWPRAHHYGMYWHRSTGGSNPTFDLIEILPGQLPSVIHSGSFKDIDNDGDLDFFGGKCRWKKARHRDPGTSDPLDVFWVELVRSHGKVRWKKHQLATDINLAKNNKGSMATDIDNDGDIDLLVPGFADKAANPIQTDIWLFENKLMDGTTVR